MVPPDRQHVVIYSGSQLVTSTVISDRQFHALTGRHRAIVAATFGELLRSDDGGAFTSVALGPIPQSDYEIALDDSETLFVGVFEPSSTRVWKQVGTGAWQQILSLAQDASILKFIDGFLYVGFKNGDVRRWSSSWSAPLFTAPSAVTDIATRGTAYFISTATSGNYEVNGSLLTRVWSANYPATFASADAVYFGGADTAVLRRTNDGALEVFDAPIYGRLMTDGTDIFIYGNGVYRYTGTQFARHPGIAEPATDAVLFATGQIGFASFSEVLTVAGPDGWNVQSPQQPPIALAGHSATDFFVTGGTILEHSNGAQLTSVVLPPGIPAIQDLAWQDSTSTLFAVGLQGLGLKRVGSTWTRLADVAGCDLSGVSIRAAGTVYAVGACGAQGVVWQLSSAGTSWMELQRTQTPLRSIFVDEMDNLYAAGPDGGVVRASGTWHVEPLARGVSISATGPSDIWVGGGSDDLVHFDGASWSRVRIVGAASPRVVATSRAVYVAGATTSVLLR